MNNFKAIYFNRDEEWRFVVSTESSPGSYLTTTRQREHLLDNPGRAEAIYWAVVDKFIEKTSARISSNLD